LPTWRPSSRRSPTRARRCVDARVAERFAGTDAEPGLASRTYARRVQRAVFRDLWKTAGWWRPTASRRASTKAGVDPDKRDRDRAAAPA
jgi:hypothetical protein